MRCPTQTAPMPPAQAEALYDLELEDSSQATSDATVDCSKSSTYEKPVIRGATLQSLTGGGQRLQQSTILQHSSEIIPPS